MFLSIASFWSSANPAIISASAVIGTGILVWWNGRVHNKTEAESAKTEAASAKAEASSLLVNDAMTLVNGLRDEINRLKAVNDAYSGQIKQLQETNTEYGRQLELLKKENALLRITVKRIENRLLSLDPHYQPESIPSLDEPLPEK